MYHTSPASYVSPVFVLKATLLAYSLSLLLPCTYTIVGIPSVRWFGVEGDYHVMVLDLMGPSLEDLFNYCGRRLNLKVKMTVVLLHNVDKPPPPFFFSLMSVVALVNICSSDGAYGCRPVIEPARVRPHEKFHP